MPTPSEETLSKNRVETFSDGVFAFVLTLLVLELHVPVIADHSSFSQYVIAVTPLVPKLVSFLLTFLIITIQWINHHYFFHHIRHTPLGMVWLNNVLLLWICLMPFPTAMLGDHPTDQFPILLYAVNSLLAGLTFFAMRTFATKNKLFEIHDHESERQFGPRHSIPAITLYTLSIVFLPVNVYLSLICLVLVPVLYFVPSFMHTKKLLPMRMR